MTAWRFLRNLAAALLMIGYPLAANAADDGLTNREIAGWPLEKQEFFVSNLVLMLGHTVSLSNEAKGLCILDWYFDDRVSVGAQILRGIQDYPDNKPTSVVIALARQACGDFPAA